MRLLNTQTLRLHTFHGDDTPPYAISSHRWGHDELMYEDVLQEHFNNKKASEGYKKISAFCRFARIFNLEWIWIDTCCINKASSSELSEAVNSMFRWYERSELCMAYLNDVTASADLNDFSQSAWFQRGWTLQELIAPTNVIFLDRDWIQIGSKASHVDLIKNITGIDTKMLLKQRNISDYSIAHRMSWAAQRETTRDEDIAYCLLGIFGINMPLLYGEGKSAFLRLQQEIMRHSSDESIFLWKKTSAESGLLAPSPASFRAGSTVSTSISTAVPTDSGYASLLQLSHSSDVKSIAGRGSILSGNQTVNFSPDHKSRLTIAFITELLDRLPIDTTLDGACTAYVDDAIESMMKRFTTDLQSLATAASQTNVALFLRQQRRRIALKIRRAFGYAENSDSSSDTSTSSRGPGEYSSHANIDKWMESTGLAEQSDDADSQREIDEIDSLILQSTPFMVNNGPFDSLISSLDILLQRASCDSLKSFAQLAEDIMQPLSSETYKYSINYEVEWDLLAYLDAEYEECRAQDVLSVLTLTRSQGDEYQALTCGEYLEQTWPYKSAAIASALRELASHPTGIESQGRRVVSTYATYSMSEGRLTVTAEGAKSDLIEIGEILAWLGSACANPEKKEVLTYTKPVFSVLEPISKLKDGSWQNSLLIQFEHQSHETLDGARTCWRGLFGGMNIADGFPIARRKHKEAGLEIALNVMAELGDSRRANMFDQRLVLKGFSSLFVATAHIASSTIWHFCSCDANDRMSYMAAIEFVERDVANITSLQSARHFVGWVDKAHQRTGTASVEYALIERPQNRILEGRRLALNELTLSFSKVISGGANFVLCRTGKKIRVATEGPLELRVHRLRNWNAVLYDDADHRAWLVDGASAVLHLLRCQLDPSTEPYGRSDSFNLHNFVHADLEGGTESAVAALRNKTNREMVIAWETKSWVEFTNGFPTEKKIQTPWKVEDLICSLWEVFELMHDALLIDKSNANHAVKLHGTDRDILEGWAFRDIADSEPHLRSRAAVLKASGRGWVDFVRSINAVPLLGRGFGDVISPQSNSNTCPHWKQMPKGKDYLAARISTLQDICSRWGDIDSHSVRLTHSSHWHKADQLFADCTCSLDMSQKCDRVQVLLPRLVVGPKRHPGQSIFTEPAYIQAAVIFGRSHTWRWNWANTGDPVQDDGVSDDDDSGIGTSLGTSRSSDGSSRLSQLSSRFSIKGKKLFTKTSP